ncbi:MULTISPECIES: MFS transporter [unclassified Streptomyces]|uniref:MFS transporter n=1 Tax=unclassified Streptomyces TaxID=2593676 RepID=UPI002E23FC18|nr:MFS transporter [Streptomyces sp. NBC_01023]
MTTASAVHGTSARPATNHRGRAPSPGIALFAALFGFFLITLDATVVTVALPAVSSDLGGGLAGLQWVVDGYTLAFAALMLSTGALSDRIGARRAYASGITLFTLASAACGLAPGLPVLIGSRVLQGVAAAVLLPASLALVRQAYPEPARRARAVSLWAAGGSVAVALGPVAGGALTSAWSWRGIFFINVPVCATALLLLSLTPRSQRRPAPLDLAGQLTAVVMLASVTFAVIEGGTAGIVAGGVALVMLAVFLRVESRHPHPVVPLGLFRNRAVSVSLGAGAANSIAFYGLIFVLSLFFQQVRGQSAMSAGLMFLPMTALIPLVNIVAGRLADRFGPRVPMLAGQLIAAAGSLLMLMVSRRTPDVLVAAALMPLALGTALTVPPLTATMLEAVPGERAGLAAGVLNAARQISGGLAVAVFGGLVAGGGFAAGMRTSLLVSAGLLALSALATARLRPTRVTIQPTAAGSAEEPAAPTA